MKDTDIKDDEVLDQEVEDKKAPKKKVKDKDEILNKNAIEINPKLNEAPEKTVVIGWGRMNPITIGHEKLVNKIKAVAKQNSATPLVYITHSQDAKKNPLEYDDKIMLAKKAFGNVVQRSKSKTIIQVMKELESKYNKVILVVGSDRIKDFDTLLNKYNGKDFTFDNIDVVSAGDRDPDAEGVDGMSASKMRVAAASGKYNQFRAGLPRKLKGDAQDVFDLVRAGMKIAEMMEEIELTEIMTLQQRRQRSMTMRKYKSKIAAARKRMKKKKASMSKLRGRARKAAIKIIRKKVAGKKGINYAKLSPGEKIMVDKKVAKKRAAIDKIAKRLLPTVRKAEMQRLSNLGKTKKESFDLDQEFDLFLESVDINESFETFFEESETSYVPKRRFHQMHSKKTGTLLLDKRFKAFKGKNLAPTPDEAKQKELLAAMACEEFDEKSLLQFIEEVSNDIIDSIDLDESKCEEALSMKAEKSGIDVDILKEVYHRGLESYQDGDHSVDSQQWAFTRVNSFIAKGKTTWYGEDQDLAERALHTAIKVKAGSKLHSKQYKAAMQTLKDLMTRKKKEGGGKLRHGIDYYAGKVAKTFKNVDGRQLADMFSEEGGAGDKGTTKLSNKYKKDTPGQITEKKKDDFETGQDPDIKDREGTQPAVYYKGLSKSTKVKRDRHFNKGTKMDDDNPAAYKPAPGDARAETKPSKHTKRFKQMYDESVDDAKERIKREKEADKIKHDRMMDRARIRDAKAKNREESVELEEKKIEGLVKKAEKSGMPYGILKQVYNRGMAAWRTGHRPGTTPQQWAFARVNSFVTKSSGTWGKADKDLADKVRGTRKEAVSPAQQAAIAISKKESGKYDKDGNKIK